MVRKRYSPAVSERTMRAVYTVPELATLAGISRWRMGRLLATNGVRFRRIGFRRTVLLSDLRLAFPELWDSILDREALG